MEKDAIADNSDEKMHAALEVNIPNYASAIATTNEAVEALTSDVLPTQIASDA